MQRKYIVTLTYELNAKDSRKGKETVAKLLNNLGIHSFDIKEEKQRRTNAQNRALHLYFTQLAEALNDAGYDMRETISNDVDIPWTPYTIKENLWRPIQEAYLKKKSTTKLNTTDIDKVYDILNRTVGERTGVSVQFPCVEDLINNKR